MAHKISIPFWRQLRWSLISAFILLAILPVLLVVGLTLPRLQQQARDHTTDQLQALADLKQEQLAHWLEDGGLVLDVFLADPTEKKLLTDFATAVRPQNLPLPPTASRHDSRQNTINSLLRSTVQTQNIFEVLFLYNANGQIIAASQPSLIGRVVSGRPYFARSLRGNYIQPPYCEIGVDGLTTLITRPLLDADGQTVGVLAGRLKMSTLGQIMTRHTGLGRTGETYLVSQESNYLVTSSRFAAEDYGLTRAYYSEGIQRALQGQDGSGLYGNYHQPAVPVIGVYRWLPELQAGLLAEVAEAEALTAFTLTRNFSLGVALASALVAALLGFYTANRIARPVADLTRVAQALGRGDYEQRATVRTGDEVETLSQALNQMASDIRQAHAGLAASEARFRTLVEQASDGIFITDPQGNYIEVNSSGCQILGYSREEILSMHLRDLISREDLAANPLKWAELQTGQTLLLERRLKRQDGTLIPVEISAKMLPDGHLQGIVRDITARKQAEQVLRESEARYRTVVESQTELICRFLPDTTLTFVNEAYCRYWDKSAEELIGRSFLLLIPGEGRQMAQEHIQSLLAQPRLETKEHPYRFPNGELRWQQWTDYPLFDQAGQVVEFQGVGRDITELKQAELGRERLLAAEREQRLLAETLQEVTLILTSHMSLETVLDEILQQARRLVPCDSLNIALLEDDRLRVVGWQGYQAFGNAEFIANLEQRLADFPLEARVVQSWQPLAVLDTAQEPDWITIDETAWIRSFLVVPICLHERVLGSLRLDSQTPGQLSIAQAQRLLPLANAAAIAMENARLYDLAQRELAERKQAEEALRESEIRYRAIVESSPDLICRFLPDTTLTFVNEAYCRYFGQTREELLGRSFLQLVPPESHEPLKAHLDALAANKLNLSYEHQVITPSGELRWQFWTDQPLLDDSGAVVEFQSVGRDTTERRQAEAAIRESEERFRQIAETIREVFYISNFNALQMLYISPAYEEVWGRSRESLYANPFSFLESIHVDDRQRIRETLARQLEGLETVEEYRIWRPDGTMRWIRDRAFPVPEASGRVSRVTGIAEDITERKRVEQALRLTRFAIDNVAEGMTTVRSDGQIVDLNETVCRRLGYRYEELLTMSIPDIDPDYPHEIWPAHWAEIKEKKHLVFEAYNRTKSGKIFPVEISIAYIEFEGVEYYCSFSRDITERKQAEKALRAYSEQLEEMVANRTRELQVAQERLLRQEKLATIGQISGSIAHELRNPLGAIKQAVFYLQRLYFRGQLVATNPKVKEHLDLMRVEIDTSDRVISDLLEMTRAKAPHPERIELRPLLIEAAERVNLAGDLQLLFDLNPEPFIFWADPVQLRQVLINVLTNADQACAENGQVMISARWLAVEAQAHIQVQDNGCGIEAGLIDKVFEPLYTTKAKGTGLGLSICKQIIEGHGGQITLRSQIKQGTTVEIRLPQPPA
jgi:PAS domain S-box-containing protein